MLTGPWEDYSGHPSLFVVHLLSCVWLSATPWAAALQAPLSSTVSRSLLKFMPTELVMLSNHLSLHRPLILLPSPFVSHQSPLSMGFSRHRILEWAAASFSKGFSQPRDWTRVSCDFLQEDSLLLSHQGSPYLSLVIFIYRMRRMKLIFQSCCNVKWNNFCQILSRSP